MKKHILYFLGGMLPFFILSCEQVIEIDMPDHQRVIVANSFLHPDSILEVYVSASMHIQDAGTPQDINDATVIVKEENGFTDTLILSQNGVYYSVDGNKPQPGKTYTIEVSAPGFENVSGIETLPLPVPVLSTVFIDSVEIVDEFGYVNGSVKFTFNDPGGERNYYQAILFHFDTLVWGTDTTILPYPVSCWSNDVEVDQAAYSFEGPIFSDEYFNGKQVELNLLFDRWEYVDNGDLYLVLGTLSENYYLYSTTYLLYQENEFNPFATPVKIYSNMSPDMGIFAGFSTVTVLVP